MSFAEKFADKDLSRYQAYYQPDDTKKETKIWYSVDLSQLLAEAPDLNVEVCDLVIRQDNTKSDDEDFLYGSSYDFQDQIAATMAAIDEMAQQLKTLPKKEDLLIVLTYYHVAIQRSQEILKVLEKGGIGDLSASGDTTGVVTSGDTTTEVTAEDLRRVKEATTKVLSAQRGIFDIYNKMLLVNYRLDFDATMMLDPVPTEAEAKAAEDRIRVKPVVETQKPQPVKVTERPLTLDQAIASASIQPIPPVLFKKKLQEWYYWDVVQTFADDLDLPLENCDINAKYRGAIVTMTKYIGGFQSLIDRFPDQATVEDQV